VGHFLFVTFVYYVLEVELRMTYDLIILIQVESCGKYVQQKIVWISLQSWACCLDLMVFSVVALRLFCENYGSFHLFAPKP